MCNIKYEDGDYLWSGRGSANMEQEFRREEGDGKE